MYKMTGSQELRYINRAVFLFFGVAIVFTLNTQGVSAYNSRLSPSSFNAGDTITLSSGPKLKSTEGTICFSSTEKCFNAGHSSILEWSNRTIKFLAPNNITNDIPYKGDLFIYDANGAEIGSAYYAFNPIIEYVTLENQNTYIDSGITGEVIDIHGFNFGPKKESVYVDDQKLSIKSWSKTLITATLPDDDKDFNVGTDMVIHRDKDKSQPYKFDIINSNNSSNDDYSSLQKYIRNSNIHKIWNTVQESTTITVAIIDSGIYLNHEDIQGQIWKNANEVNGNGIDDDQNGYIDDYYGWNFINNSRYVDVVDSHGTFVAGIIGANRNNSIGISGIVQNVKLMPVIACDDYGCPTTSIVDSIIYSADNGADIINISLGISDISGYSTAFDDAIEYAWNKGVTIVVAAGNGDSLGKGIDTTITPQSLVCNESRSNMIIGVGASTRDNKNRTPFSNYGNCVDIFAQGEDVVSTDTTEYNYNINDGTSFSAPIVSGTIALVLSEHPYLTNEDIYKYLVGNQKGAILNAESFYSNVLNNYNPSDSSIFEIDIKSSLYKEAIRELKQKGIIEGYPDGTFKPFKKINRAEFTKLVIAGIGKTQSLSKCFPDVNEEWFAEYVCTAKKLGIVNGYQDGTFQPTSEINVSEALSIILKAFELDIETPTADEDWFDPIIRLASQEGVYLSSFTNKFVSISREEMAELIYRMINK